MKKLADWQSMKNRGRLMVGAVLLCACSASVAKTAPTRLLAEQTMLSVQPTVQGPLHPPAQTVGQRAAPQAPRRASRAPQAPPLASAAPASTRPVSLAPLIDRTARTHNIDPLLLHAIARVESRHQPDAISHAGAHGLMQVIVPTAQRFGVHAAEALHDPQTNLWVSARYLKTLQQRFGNNLTLVLAAYNAGEGAVEKYGWRVPPYRETQSYVRKVLSEYQYLRHVAHTGRPP